jgi:putative oxidoreductase
MADRDGPPSTRADTWGVGVIVTMILNSPLGFEKLYRRYNSFFSSSSARWAPLPIRLIVGYGFAEHGFAKLLRGADNFTGLLHSMGMPFPHFLAWLTISTEVVGGVCVLAGALVPVVSIPMAIILLVAIFTVHLQYGFSSIKLQEITPAGARFGQPGYETDVLYLAGIAALVLGGSGPFSFDGWMFRRPGPASNKLRVSVRGRARRLGASHDTNVPSLESKLE